VFFFHTCGVFISLRIYSLKVLFAFCIIYIPTKFFFSVCFSFCLSHWILQEMSWDFCLIPLKSETLKVLAAACALLYSAQEGISHFWEGVNICGCIISQNCSVSLEEDSNSLLLQGGVRDYGRSKSFLFLKTI
jgi:hypothetical protein